MTCHGTGEACWYGGSIDWPSGTCTDGCYSAIVGGFTGNLNNAVDLLSCGGSLSWTFSEGSPTSPTLDLLVTITAADGTQVFAETAILYTGDSIGGTYTACQSPSSSTTTTVTFTSPTSTTTSSVYQPSYQVSVIYQVLQPKECGRPNSLCSYQFDIDWGLAAGGIDGASGSSQTFPITFPNCNTPLTYSFTLEAPLNVTNLIFQIQDSSGNTVYQVSAAAANSTNLQGSFQPSCSATSSSSTSSPAAGYPSMFFPSAEVAFGLLVLCSFVSVASFEVQRSRRQRLASSNL